ncbi:MAG TPA: YbaB/EbfC family nucleoid-associated protein [Chloroflexota bacterium]|nr:YbaB/EbfC family nucleoid-associated protein [Chloroflexota bacterium]
MGMAMFQQMQNKMLKMQEELAKETVEASAGGGAVTVTMTGQMKVQGVKIDPEVVDADDVEILQDLIVAAVNEAVTKSQELQAKRLSSITGGMKIPGLM